MLLSRQQILTPINSGNDELGDVGRKWASDNGYTIVPSYFSGGGPTWGSQ